MMRVCLGGMISGVMGSTIWGPEVEIF